LVGTNWSYSQVHKVQDIIATLENSNTYNFDIEFLKDHRYGDGNNYDAGLVLSITKQSDTKATDRKWKLNTNQWSEKGNVNGIWALTYDFS